MARPEDVTVLVVDDEPDIVFFLKLALQDHGFNVITASDGVEALDKMHTKKPDLISLDLVMPGASGIRFFHILRRNREWANIPVLFVTGHAHDSREGADMMGVLEGKALSGPATYLEKPVNAETFISKVKAILGVERGPDEMKEPKRRSLRQEAEDLLRDAGSEDLEEIVKLLRQRKRSKEK